MYPPHAKLTRVVDAVAEPVSLAMMKGYLRLEHEADDDLVGFFLKAARYQVEQLNDRSFVTTTWKLAADFLPYGVNSGLGFLWPGYARHARADQSRVYLPMPPLIDVTSIAYVDQSGATQTLDPSNFVVSTGTPGTIFPAYGHAFPYSQGRPSAVQIIYRGGYGDDPASVPPTIPMAIMLLAAHFYSHRSEQAPIPDALMNVLLATDWGGYA